MDKINPQISQKFLEQIKNQIPEIIDIEGVKIKTCRGVFPPRSNFSHTSEKLHTIFGDLTGLNILDMGTGTGIQAIQAIKDGAKSVVVVDINPAAISCAEENFKLNGVSDKITAFESDLFIKIENGNKFDIIIANLPITDFPLNGLVESALYDPEYKIHKRFLKEATSYLQNSGAIIMTHIDFKGNEDFKEFEEMLSFYNFKPERYIEIEDMGYRWRMYRIIRK
ncbi:class I SAM-dependent methyltransferase [Candidatus Nomurabacteria bacterium]|jgi:release factor glutamine methyltransferase|nr:MAG: class I SAM-dependent methyltransferase [Candidatus Nomurabacteria bacterium]